MKKKLTAILSPVLEVFNVLVRRKPAMVVAGIILVYTFIFPELSSAQILPLAAQYYQNQYLANPAFAGMTEGANVNLSYRNQWRVIPGSPVNSVLTGDYRFDNKVGVGLKIFTDKAGLISRNSISGTYAYHLPLSDDSQEIHFGLSLAVLKDKLDYEGVIGEENDLDIDAFNTRRIYLDSDFGLAYTTKRLTLQGVIPNMKTFFKKDQSNSVQVSTMYLAMAYKIGTALDVVSIEPKISYVGASGVDDIWNLGTNIKVLNDKVSFTGMYHSTKSSSLGVGLSYQRYLIQGFYTSQLAGQREATGGSFELHLKVNFLKKEDVRNTDKTY